jgi:membrane associated rhomboid family serine protease
LNCGGSTPSTLDPTNNKFRAGMPLVEVFRSNRQVACDQRAFVLHAVGIASEVLPYENAFLLFVDTQSAAAARDHIERYNLENATVAKPKPMPTLHGNAWITPVVFTLAVFSVGYCAAESLFGFDWYDVGALHPGVQYSGEWWRLLTALTLHLDAAHLFGNIAFGTFFSYLAARLLGPGVAWASIVLAAAAGNLLDSILMPATHASMGASTAVFATLGLVAAYSWRLQFSKRMQWAHRWAPLICGIMLLALLGAGGENTDVLAHLTGFFCGAVLGASYARVPTKVFSNLLLQIGVTVVATAAIVGAWMWAGVSA